MAKNVTVSSPVAAWPDRSDRKWRTAGGMSHRDRRCHHRVYDFNPELKAGAGPGPSPGSCERRAPTTMKKKSHHRRRDDGDLIRGSAPHTDPKWLPARRPDGAGQAVWRRWIPASGPAHLPTMLWDVCREMGLVRAPTSGCVPGQSAPLLRSKRQRLKFQEGSEGRGTVSHDMTRPRCLHVIR